MQMKRNKQTKRFKMLIKNDSIILTDGKNVCRKCESIQYPVLYDKKVKGFKESHTVQ